MIARISLLVLAAAACGFAHGIDATVLSGGVGIEARYADGSPAAFAEVKVFPPDGRQVFQEGLTDREGRFLFHPSTTGRWRIALDDGMGHALTQEIAVDDTGPVTPATAAPRTRAMNVFAGLGIIWGIFGTLAWWRARKRD